MIVTKLELGLLCITPLEDWDQEHVRQGGRSSPDLRDIDFTITFEESKQFLHRCHEWHLRLKPQKCQHIDAPKIDDLGYDIDKPPWESKGDPDHM